MRHHITPSVMTCTSTAVVSLRLLSHFPSLLGEYVSCQALAL
jgi:hypothetical protein